MYNRNSVTREGLDQYARPTMYDGNKEDFTFVYRCLRTGRIYQDMMVFIPVNEKQPADGEPANAENWDVFVSSYIIRIDTE